MNPVIWDAQTPMADGSPMPVHERIMGDEIYRLDELYARPELTEPPFAIIEQLAFMGRTTLIASREKCGKSTLLSQAVSAMTRGEPFLNGATRCGFALWYAVDEPLGDLVRRFKIFRPDEERVFVRTGRPSAAQMSEDVGGTGAHIVVIDTLTELWAAEGVNENDSGEVASFLRPYITVARERDLSLVLLHHTRKDGRESRGSVQIAATVDAPLILRRKQLPQSGQATDEEDPEDEDGFRWLSGMTRWGSVKLRLQWSDGQYRMADAPESLAVRVCRMLAEGETSTSGLSTALHVRKERAVDIVHELCAGGYVVRDEKQRLRLTPLGEQKAATGPFPSVVPRVIAGTGPHSHSLNPGTTEEPVRNGSRDFGNGPGNESAAPVPERLVLGDKDGNGYPSRVIDRDGAQIRQWLRPTAHGDKWFDEAPEVGAL